MDIEQWLEKYANKVETTMFGEPKMIWITKSRGDYITMEGVEKDLSHLLPLINVSSTWDAGKPVNIGFNPSDNKWYGWSHRAIFGFGIGSEVKRGDCAYRPTDKDDFLQDMVRFWSDDDKLNIHGEHREDGVYIEWEYDQSVPNEKCRGQITGVINQYPEEYGKGEWKAETMSDALQMAIDFANSVA